MYSRQATHSEVDEADIPSIPPSIDLSDPHQLHRTILQVILSILCLAMAVSSFAPLHMNESGSVHTSHALIDNRQNCKSGFFVAQG